MVVLHGWGPGLNPQHGREDRTVTSTGEDVKNLGPLVDYLWWGIIVISRLGRWREENKEFTVNLCNIVELKGAWAAWESVLRPSAHVLQVCSLVSCGSRGCLLPAFGTLFSHQVAFLELIGGEVPSLTTIWYTMAGQYPWEACTFLKRNWGVNCHGGWVGELQLECKNKTNK